MTVINLQLPALYDQQYHAIYSPARYAVIEAATKTGKTTGCLHWLLHLAATTGGPGRWYWWVAPSYGQARDIGYDRLKRMLAKADPAGLAWTAVDTLLTIELANGAKLAFKTAEKPDLLYGQDVYGLVVDEATRCRREAWISLRSVITYTGAPVRLIGNVKGRRNWAYEEARKAQAGEKDMSYAKLTYLDAVAAGVLPEQEAEEARRHMPEAAWRELYLAEPSDEAGNPFGLAFIRAATMPEDWRGAKPVVAWGVDLAKYQDWTVAVGLNARGEVAGYQRWQTDWRNTIARLEVMLGHTPALVDATGVGDPVLEMLHGKCPAAEGQQFTPQSKQEMMLGLVAVLHREAIKVPDGPIVRELEVFEYEPLVTEDGRVKGVRYSAPPGMHDDCVCALALAVKCMQVGPRPSMLAVIGTDLEPVPADDEAMWVSW